MVRKILIVIFGAAPATFLCLFAIYGVVSGIKLSIMEQDVTALLLAIWGFLGIVGTVAIWRAAIGHPMQRIIPGLIVGAGALFPVSLTAVFSPESVQQLMWQVTAFGPLIVVVYLLAEYIVRRQAESSSTY